MARYVVLIFDSEDFAVVFSSLYFGRSYLPVPVSLGFRFLFHWDLYGCEICFDTVVSVQVIVHSLYA